MESIQEKSLQLKAMVSNNINLNLNQNDLIELAVEDAIEFYNKQLLEN